MVVEVRLKNSKKKSSHMIYWPLPAEINVYPMLEL